VTNKPVGLAITLTVHCDLAPDVLRVQEALCRAATGYALDGLHVNVALTPLDYFEDADDDGGDDE
jgi:hypothetical protein